MTEKAPLWNIHTVIRILSGISALALILFIALKRYDAAVFMGLFTMVTSMCVLVGYGVK